MYNNICEIQSYCDADNRGGETVGVSPLYGYPRDLSIQDLEAIFNNHLDIDAIVAKYPVPNNLWAKKGFITYKAFKQANANVDPLAVRAVFYCFSQSAEVSNPEIAQQKIDRYKESLETFKKDLLYSKVVGWAAILTLLGLLGLAGMEAYGYAYTGWFPDWPRNQKIGHCTLDFAVAVCFYEYTLISSFANEIHVNQIGKIQWKINLAER